MWVALVITVILLSYIPYAESSEDITVVDYRYITLEQERKELKEDADMWFYASQTVIIADWLTTRDCADQDWCYEANPFVAAVIGKEDIDKTKLDILSVGTLIGNWVMQDYMTDHQRLHFNRTHTIVRFVVVGNNLRLGLKIRW